MERFTLENKQVELWPSEGENWPVIYLNTFEGEGERVWQEMRRRDLPDFSLAAVSGLDWNRDLPPWDAPAIYKGAESFSGGAEAYLAQLTGKILPAVEQRLKGRPVWRALAGYSLAGAFAVYGLYHTGAFCRAASVSGSLWFPGLKEYLLSHEMQNRPDCLYFSLGNKESKTRNPAMKVVEQNTWEIEGFFHSKGVKTVFQLNPGGHFQEPEKRVAAALGWLLEQ